MKTLDITLPVYNEEKTLYKNVEKIILFCEMKLNNIINICIIIVDNGSTDSTSIVAQNLIRNYPQVIKFIQLPQKGVGLALKTSWLQSDADLVGYMDLDLSTDLMHLTEVVDLFIKNEKMDLVVGSRLNSKSHVIGRSIIREITSRTLNFILKIVFKNNFDDGMCGFKFMKKNLVEDIIKNGANSDAWFFCAEILIVSEWLDYKIYEIPVKWTDDLDSKVNIFSLAKECLLGIFYLKTMRCLK
ncbi:MAG: glycosyltransferase [Pseudobdellovibrio sp.]